MNQTNPGRTAKRTAETTAEEETTIEWAIEIKAATTTTKDETMTIVDLAITEITTTLTTETTVWPKPKLKIILHFIFVKKIVLLRNKASDKVRIFFLSPKIFVTS